jgi:CO/xanthine dehydrogenase FAD-binding subunit
MRAYLPDYDLQAPATLADALAVLSSEPGRWRPFAGGTDLMVTLDAGRLPEGRYLGLWRLKELRGIDDRGAWVSLGALTTYTDVLSNSMLRAEFPLLGRAAEETGGVATQNRGTIGGNIANASPAADTPPALLAYDAELEIVSTRGARRVPYDRFHHGYKQMDLAPDELIARIDLPRRARPWRQHYRKVGTRRAQAISKVCLAAAMDDAEGVVGDVRITFGSVAPTVVRARRAEDALRGRALDRRTIDAALDALAGDLAPIDDIRSTSRYRALVARQLLAEWLDAVAPAAARQSPAPLQP